MKVRQLKPKWTVNWSCVDRNEFFRDLRKYKDHDDRKFWGAVTDSVSLWDDEDRENIIVSVEVPNLWELVRLMAAMSGVRAGHGVVLHCYADDSVVSMGASLSLPDSSFEEASAQVTLKIPKHDKFAAVKESLDAVEDQLHEARQRLLAAATT